jgi:hypothetical protein
VAPLQTSTLPAAGGGRPGTAGLGLSGIVHSVFRERTQPLFALDARIVPEMLRAYGSAADPGDFLARTGTGFTAMSEALLARRPGPLPETDAVLLAYETPDLYHPGVAGCYLSQRLPGAPVPCSVADQGPGAVFTALRIADGMLRLGELARGAALFAFDQNAAVHPAAEVAEDRPDAAVLLWLGATGEATVAELDEVCTAGPDGPTPAQALAAAMDRHPGARVLAGAGLAVQLGDGRIDNPADSRRIETAAPGASCTGVWAALARLWPLREPVLLADHHAPGDRFHSCLLVPEAGA